jgi:hypothetical protein
VLGERDDELGELALGGLGAGEHEPGDDRGDVDVVEALAVDLDLEQVRHEIVGGMRPAVGDEGRAPRLQLGGRGLDRRSARRGAGHRHGGDGGGPVGELRVLGAPARRGEHLGRQGLGESATSSRPAVRRDGVGQAGGDGGGHRAMRSTWQGERRGEQPGRPGARHRGGGTVG